MGYYISPRFLDTVAIHITKNFMDLPEVRVPLILGIHGRKGEGKSFQCELVFQHMGIEPVRMSAGELESPDAGDPVRLLRARYREAAELIRVRGKMCVLLINDLDAGAGRVDQTTQYTVNTQLVNGTLMNIADNPTDVQLPGSYETEPIHRVPIIVTGNDFSTLYAPLIRDGRMTKFYWEPLPEERVGIVKGIFEPDRLLPGDVEQLVEAFPQQSIDFFGALRSRVYDEQVRQFIYQVGIERVSTYIVNSRDKSLKITNPQITLAWLMELGQEMVQEQTRIHTTRLAQEYLSGATQTVQTVQTVAPSQATSVPLTLPGNGRRSYGPRAAAGSSPPIAVGTVNPAIAMSSSSEYAEKIKAWPSHVSLPEVERLLEQAMLQGSRLSLEVARPREKAGNIWRSWSWPQVPDNAAQAVEGIIDCLQENPGSFIKLVGYNPQTQKRLMEEMIIRP